MIEYDPGRYASLHDAFPLLWTVLNEEERVSQMELASRLNSPAVSVLDIGAEDVWEVLEAAKRLGLLNQVKQMIGHQIRQIMESRGYEHVRNKPLSTSWIFASGAVYRHPSWTMLYVHKKRLRSTDENARYCVASKRSLSDLRIPHDSPLVPSEWVRYRKVARRRELDFVMDAPLSDFGWRWRNLCDKVRADGFVILYD